MADKILKGIEVGGETYSIPTGSEVVANGTLQGGEPTLKSLTVDNQTYALDGILYTTTAPVADNTDGTIKIALLSAEPAVKYDGWIYIIVVAYNITSQITNGSASGAVKIKENGHATITIAPDTGYKMPSSVVVMGASYTYDSTTGEVVLSNPTGDVYVTAYCESNAFDVTITVKGANSGYDTTYAYDGVDNTGTLLGTMYTEGTYTFTVSSGHICFVAGYGENSAGSCTGGVSFVGYYGTDPEHGKSSDGQIYSVTGNGSINDAYFYYCFVEGTKITLADGSTKNVEDITYDDDLLVWDFYEGKLNTAKPIWIMIERGANYYKLVTLSDGTVLRLVGGGDKCHRVYDVDAQEFRYANECVGHRVYKQDGNMTTIVSCEIVEEQVKYYNLTTEKYLDCFAEGVLTGSRLNNMYHIGTNMQYDSDERLISEKEEAQRWATRWKEAKPR